jgi:hypothetical protein
MLWVAQDTDKGRLHSASNERPSRKQLLQERACLKWPAKKDCRVDGILLDRFRVFWSEGARLTLWCMSLGRIPNNSVKDVLSIFINL